MALTMGAMTSRPRRTPDPLREREEWNRKKRTIDLSSYADGSFAATREVLVDPEDESRSDGVATGIVEASETKTESARRAEV